MKIAICDDMQADRAMLRKALDDLACSKNLSFEIKEYTDGTELMDLNMEMLADFELFFFDIYMPKSNGMETAKNLRERGISVPFIFVTTSSDFAVESYDVDALFYLVKPIRLDKLKVTMERFLEGYRPRSIFLDGRLFALNNIVFAESVLKIVCIYFKDGTHIELREKLDNVESQLTGCGFLRCHQSYIVNLNYVKRIENGVFITTLDQVVMIRKRDFPGIRKVYYDYLKAITGIGGKL